MQVYIYTKELKRQLNLIQMVTGNRINPM